MTVKKRAKSTDGIMPILKTVEQMGQISGIGENRLRELIAKGEIEYVQNGNRYLLTDQAILNWYERNRILPADTAVKGGIA